MDTVTAPTETRPEYGSIEYYANRLRAKVTTRRDLSLGAHEMYAVAYIETAVENHTLSGDELRVRIRNILAAAERVADEIRAAER